MPWRQLTTLFSGNVSLGGTLFTPLLINSYQEAYGNIYSSLTDICEPAYPAGIDTQLHTTIPPATLIAPSG